MKKVNSFKKYSIYTLLAVGLLFTGCKKEEDDAPEVENEEEVITDVKLIFTNKSNASDVVIARAKDPDGAGVKELEILDEINLDTSKTYTLSLQIENNLTTPGEDITKEILEEQNDHQFFFKFSNNAFKNPEGDGNFDNATHAVVYNDKDEKGNNLGLSTTWVTSNSLLKGGDFVIRLQHQPTIKTATTGVTDGDTDLELRFVLNIK